MADPEDLALERAVLGGVGRPRVGDLVIRYRRELAPLVAGLAVLLVGALGHQAAPGAWLLPLALGAVGTGAWCRWKATRDLERIYAGGVGSVATLTLALGWALGIAHGWLLLTVLLASIAAGVPWWQHQLPRSRVKAGPAPREIRRLASRHVEAWPAIASAVGLAGVRVQSIEPDEHGWTMRLRLPAGRVVRDVVAKVEHLESALRVRPSGVRVEADRTRADRLVVRVNVTNPLEVAIPWPGPSGRSIADPVRLGPFEDREAIEVRVVGQHWLLAGGTGSGKSVTQRVLLAELLSRRDVVVFAIDVAKRGLQFLPFQASLHWLAIEPGEAVRMLQATLEVQRARAAWMAGRGLLEWPLSPEAPQLVVLIDELSDLLTIPGVADLLEALVKLGREQGVTIIGASQRTSADAMGGSAVARTQFSVRIALRCRERRDGDLILGEGRAAEGWRPDRLQAPGSMLVLSDEHQVPRPGRSYLLTADEARELARSVIDTRARLDAGSAAALAAVRGSEAEAAIPVSETAAPSGAVLPEPEPGAAPGSVRAARLTADDRVSALIGAVGVQGLAANDIAEMLADVLSRRAVFAALRRLEARGAIAQRDSGGEWVAVAGADES